MSFFVILRDSLYFYRRNFQSIAQICLPLIVPIALSRAWVDMNAEADHTLLVYGACIVLFQPTYTAALILFLNERRDDLRPRVLDLWFKALKLWPQLIMTGLLVSLAAILGTVAFILPAIWIVARLCLSQFFLVARGLGPVAAVKKSFSMTKGYFWLTFACLFGLVISLGILEVLLDMAFISPENPSLLLSFVIYALVGMVQTFILTVLFRLFTRIEEAGASPEIDDTH